MTERVKRPDDARSAAAVLAENPSRLAVVAALLIREVKLDLPDAFRRIGQIKKARKIFTFLEKTP